MAGDFPSAHGCRRRQRTAGDCGSTGLTTRTAGEARPAHQLKVGVEEHERRGHGNVVLVGGLSERCPAKGVNYIRRGACLQERNGWVGTGVGRRWRLRRRGMGALARCRTERGIERSVVLPLGIIQPWRSCSAPAYLPCQPWARASLRPRAAASRTAQWTRQAARPFEAASAPAMGMAGSGVWGMGDRGSAGFVSRPPTHRLQRARRGGQMKRGRRKRSACGRGPKGGYRRRRWGWVSIHAVMARGARLDRPTPTEPTPRAC